VVSSLLIVALVIGVPFTLSTFVVTGVLVSAGGFAIGERRRRRSGPSSGSAAPSPGGNRPGARIDQAALAAFVVILAVYAVIGLRDASPLPLDAFDGWSIWARKAVILTHFDSLPLGFFDSRSYEFMHQDYPLLVPAFEAIHFRAMGEADTQAIHLQFWCMLIGFVWAMAFLASHVTRPIVWAPVLLLVAASPAVTSQLLSTYADVPAAMFLCTGVLALGIWFAQRSPSYLLLAAILLGGSASTKNEGLMAGTTALAVVALLVVAGRDRVSRKTLMWGAGVFIAMVLPWQIWLAVHGISGDISLSDGLSPGFLSSHSDRVWPSVESMYTQMTDQSEWLYLLPLGLGAAIVALVALRSRIAVFYLATGGLVFIVLVWAYVVRPGDLTWLLGTSANRVVALIIFLAIPAILQLAGELEPRLQSTRDGPRSVASERSPP
jgi:hypothetical protein